MSRDGIWEVIDTLQTPRRFETALRKRPEWLMGELQARMMQASRSHTRGVRQSKQEMSLCSRGTAQH